MEKRQPLQQVVLGKLTPTLKQRNENTLSHTIYKNKLKMLYRPKCKT